MVEQIQQKAVGSELMDFYSLRVLNDNSIIFVPLANADSVGIRPIITSIQCKKLINKLSAAFEPISIDWKTRSKDFAVQLQSGDVFEAADVLKKLTYLSREKKLSFREQNLLEKSKFLIVSELINADGADEDALRADIERLVEKACDHHTLIQPKVMTAGVH